MSFRVTEATITGRTGSGGGFDLTLDPEHVRAIYFAKKTCTGIESELGLLELPVDTFFEVPEKAFLGEGPEASNMAEEGTTSASNRLHWVRENQRATKRNHAFGRNGI